MTTEDSDGYRLNAKLRGQRAIPTPRMVDALASIAFDMRQARKGNWVLAEQWVSWSRKERANGDALVRVLFLIISAAQFTAEDIEALGRQLRDTSVSRRRPTQLIHETKARQSPRLW